jgi:hypothetical protein
MGSKCCTSNRTQRWDGVDYPWRETKEDVKGDIKTDKTTPIPYFFDKFG